MASTPSRGNRERARGTLVRVTFPKCKNRGGLRARGCRNGGSAAASPLPNATGSPRTRSTFSGPAAQTPRQGDLQPKEKRRLFPGVPRRNLPVFSTSAWWSPWFGFCRPRPTSCPPAATPLPSSGSAPSDDRDRHSRRPPSMLLCARPPGMAGIRMAEAGCREGKSRTGGGASNGEVLVFEQNVRPAGVELAASGT